MAEQTTARRGFNLGILTANRDILVAVAAVGVVLMLIIPLPTWLLDILLIANLSLSLMVILSTVYIKKPADFSTFPTLILMTTVFGLALNVSSTRLILTDGYAGHIIDAFGNFVIRDNLVVGLIIFIILLAIQFLVITKGASRVAEVAARFNLDAMQGKQFAIDQDLNAGLIDEKEAIRRREELRIESDFYGNMDGSSKFVSGNVKVALVVTIVDIIGGLIVGMVSKGYDAATAANKYIMLTVGDGLVSQIPAMLISTATGIIVTRNAVSKNFAGDVVSQISTIPKVLYISAVAILILGFLPGFPTLLTFFVAVILGGVGYLLQRSTRIKETKIEEEKKLKQPEEHQTTYDDIVRVDPMNLEIGINLIPLVEKDKGGDLLDRIKMIRRRVGLDMGILVPPIRIIDNISIDNSEYVVKIFSTEVGKGKVMINRLLAMNPKLNLDDLDGIEVKEPAFGLPAKWINEDQRSKAESMGFDIFDPPSVVATHLTEIIKKNAHTILNRQDVQQMLDALKKEYPKVVEEVLKTSKGVGDIQKVLQNLLKEEVSIRNMLPILEAIADYGTASKNIDQLTEHVRQELGRQIAGKYADESNTLKGIIVDVELDRMLGSTVQETPQGQIASPDPELIQVFVNQSYKVTEDAMSRGVQPVILCSQKVRRLVREILERRLPSIPVMSYTELPNNFSLDQVGVIHLNRA